MNASQREEFFRRLAEINPKPVTELNYSSPFELLVAVTLSAFMGIKPPSGSAGVPLTEVLAE